MRKSLSFVPAALITLVLTMTGCVYGPARPAAEYDGYYDGYYGPYVGGYWGADATFYYSDGHGHYLHDASRHFRREHFGHANGFHADREHHEQAEHH